MRPLAGDDKVDIEHMAQEIGTYEFAKEGIQCCDLAPKYPALAAKLEDALCAEEQMDPSILQTEVRNARIIVLRSGRK